MRYLIYARKSSESDDKQAQSIDDQLKELRSLVEERRLDVAAEYTEARSAKAPGGRPVFAEVVARIQAGEADAILCWHVNRLFRNPVDFGTVSWLLQTGALKEIRTPHQVHRTGDNVLLLSVENGMANQYIIDLKKSVERGLASKVEKGWFPHRAPEGYRNVDAEIRPDPARFELIRQMWDMALAGTPVLTIWREMERLGYRTVQRKRSGGAPLSVSGIYRLLENIFYAGYFVRAGETFQGAHVPMITLTEFYAVQKRIQNNRRRFRRHAFAFNGLIRCGHCGCGVVGEYKHRVLRDGTRKTYSYYSCGNPRHTCRRRVLAEEEIVRQISGVLGRLTVDAEFADFADRAIRRWAEEAKEGRETVKHEQAEAIQDLERKMDRLVQMKLNDLLTDPEFLEQKLALREQIMRARLEQQIAHEASDAEWTNLENAVQFCQYGRAIFEGGTPAVQRLVAETLGAQYVLTDRRLAIELKPLFGRIAELKDEAESGSGDTKRDALDSKHRVWWNTLEAIRIALSASGLSIPNLVLNGAVAYGQPSVPTHRLIRNNQAI